MHQKAVDMSYHTKSGETSSNFARCAIILMVSKTPIMVHVPAYKAGDKQEFGSYRPIPLLSFFFQSIRVIYVQNKYHLYVKKLGHLVNVNSYMSRIDR